MGRRATRVQSSFNAGELSPRLRARGDLPAYQAGAETLSNWYVLRPGGLERRPGTIKVADAKDSEKKCREIPFRFSESDAYNLEFCEFLMRVFSAERISGRETLLATAIRSWHQRTASVTIMRARISPSAPTWTSVHP